MEDVELNTRVNRQSIPRKFVPAAIVGHPWRRRKGVAFVRQYARSAAYYVKLHPHQRESFELKVQALAVLRSWKRNILFVIKTRQFKGFCGSVSWMCTGIMRAGGKLREANDVSISGIEVVRRQLCCRIYTIACYSTRVLPKGDEI